MTELILLLLAVLLSVIPLAAGVRHNQNKQKRP